MNLEVRHDEGVDTSQFSIEENAFVVRLNLNETEPRAKRDRPPQPLGPSQRPFKGRHRPPSSKASLDPSSDKQILKGHLTTNKA